MVVLLEKRLGMFLITKIKDRAQIGKTTLLKKTKTVLFTLLDLGK